MDPPCDSVPLQNPLRGFFLGPCSTPPAAGKSLRNPADKQTDKQTAPKNGGMVRMRYTFDPYVECAPKETDLWPQHCWCSAVPTEINTM